MAWAEWDTNLDSYLKTSFTECNSVTIATAAGDCICSCRTVDDGPQPTVAELSSIAIFLKTKSSSETLQYGSNKLMFTREIDDSLAIFNLKGDVKGAVVVCKSVSGNFLLLACGAGENKNSQAVGVQAIKFVEFLKRSL